MTCVLFYGESAQADASFVEGLLSSVSRRADEVYRDLGETLVKDLLKTGKDLFVFGVPPFDVIKTFSEEGKPVDGVFSDGERVLAYSEGLDITSLSAVIAKIKDIFGLSEKRVVFRLYGETGAAVERTLAELAEGYPFVLPFVTERDRDVRVDFVLKKDYPPEALDVFLKAFLDRYGSEIYADEDVGVVERFMAVMKLYGRKLAVAESMTGGNIAATIVRHAGASEIFYEGLTTYDVRAKFHRLGVKASTVEKHTVVSGEVAYEMARALVGENSSVGISVTGYAPSVTPSRSDGLCYIGVAVDDKTRVYRFVFSGNRETVIKKATTAAIFSALKLLTENFFET